MKRMKKDIIHVMDESILRGEMPCALALLWRDDEEKFFHASGFADLGRNLPVGRDSIFRLFSLTKPMTAVAALTLVERGLLDIDAPVSDFLEGFKDQQVALDEAHTEPVHRAMMVRDLFSMTSGLCYPGDQDAPARAAQQLFDAFEQEEKDGAQPSTVAAANRIGKLPLAFHPGEGWRYSTCADLLGAVVEVVAGQPLDDYMAETIFEPLSMDDTGFFVPENKQTRLCTLYEHKDGILSPYPRNHLGLNDNLTRPNFISGGAGLTSTIGDVLRFARMLLNNGTLDGKRILGPRTVAWLSHDHLTQKQRAGIEWDNMTGYGYGALVRVLQEPSKSFSLGVPGEFGWDGWTGPYMSIIPQENAILLMMQQRTDSGITSLTRKVRNIVFARMS